MESTDMTAKAVAQTGEAASRHRRRRLAVLVAGGLGVVVLAGWAATQPPETWVRARELAVLAMEWVRGLGAAWFFAAFAVLPAFGFPVSVFPLSAGPLFGATLGLPAVLGLAGLSMATSMSISYGLARFILRPWVTRMLGYLGYVVPVVPVEKRRMFVVLVRITPGPPYVLQNFLLGLAGVPFGLYLAISWVICTVSVSLLVVFGDALAQGKGRVALLALAGVVLVVLAVKALRRKVEGRALRNEGDGGDEA
jgi:uncharacterized membrane protein YdjX (TVP38/TMEM64 family)